MILGDAKQPVKDVFLDTITINKVLGQTNRYVNAENVHETNVRVLELVSDDKAGK
jgi:hypothetical protein